MSQIIIVRVGLLQAELRLSSPVHRRVQDSFAQPTQNGKSGFPVARSSLIGRSSKPLPVEPIVPVTEPLDSVLARHRRLLFANLRQHANRKSLNRRAAEVDDARGTAAWTRVTFVHSVNPLPHQLSFSGIGWN